MPASCHVDRMLSLFVCALLVRRLLGANAEPPPRVAAEALTEALTGSTASP